jgi:peptidyl-prolyl cis-trans isomerase D
MLQNIGDKFKGQNEGGSRAHRWFWYSILGALALVFIAWGPYAAVDLSFGQSSYAAKVNGETISAAEMDRQWQDQQPRILQAFGGQISEEQRVMFQQQLLDSAVRGVATRQYATGLGFRVSDAQVAKAFQEEQAFHVDGQFNLLAARSRLASLGITEAAYVAEVRQSLLANQLVGSIGVSGFLTPNESKRLLGLLDEQRETRFVLLNPTDFAGTGAFASEAIEAYYKAHTADFAVPESVHLAYAELSLADVAGSVQVTEEQLKARYEQDKATYQQAETRRASHILITVDSTTDDAKAAAQAQDLYKQITGGADFAALARQYSKDSLSAAKGGDLDWAGRDTYAKEFSDKLFSMQQGQVSEPVKTQYGYHIIRLDGIRAAQGRSFEDVRGELTAQLRNEQAGTMFGERQDRLQERIERGAGTLAELAQEFGMRRGDVAQFERGTGGLPLGSDAELNREVFSDASISQHHVGGPLPLGEERLVIFQVTEHRPASTQPLEAVRSQVVDALTRERGATAAWAAAESAVADLGKGASFEQVAAKLKAKAEPARYVGRGSPDLPVELRDAVFAAARPEAGKPIRQALKIEGGGVAVYEVTAWRVETQLDNPQLVQLRSERELQRYTQRDIDAYLTDVMSEAKVRKNPQAFLQQ